jgi:NitT/TauT family transport system permease protein
MAVLKKLLKYFLIILLWLGIWAAASYFTANEWILPSIPTVMNSLAEMATSPNSDFWGSIAFSFIRVVFGLTVAIGLAILLAALAFRFSIIHDILKPPVAIIKATPVVSFIFIAFIIFSKNMEAFPPFIAGLIVFPVIYESLYAALKKTPRELVEVSAVFGCTWYEKLRYLWIPCSLPDFITSTKTSIGLAWKSGIAAEALFAIPSMTGIGQGLFDAKSMLYVDRQFAWTLVIILLSLTVELIFSFASKKLTDKIL